MKKVKIKTSDLVLIAIFAAISAILSQISIPLPGGVPVTLQTFAVALCGYYLGWKKGLTAILVYILLGAAGVPVFANFSGGIGSIAGPSGGFIYGFLFMAALCGLPLKQKPLKIVSGCIGLLICHLCGVVQFSLVMGNGFTESFLLASAPFLIKDIVSIVAAFFSAMVISKATRTDSVTTAR